MVNQTYSCWCWFAQRQAKLKGTIIGKRQAEILKVEDCQENCGKKRSEDCLIGRELESRWL